MIMVKLFKAVLLIVVIVSISHAGFSQFKKIPAYIDGKSDTLDFPGDFRNRTGIPIGEKLPSFSYTDIYGETIASTDFDNKLLVLNFWFVGCKGCKQEEPYLTILTEDFKNKNVEFVSFCQSSPARTRSYINKNGDFGYKVVSIKSKKEIIEKFGVETFTTHLIIRDGVVRENFSFPLTTDDEIGWFKEQILVELDSTGRQGE
jgi:peroxiredoxin